MRPKILTLFSTLLLWSGTQAIAAPGDNIGSAVRIVNLVTAEYEADARKLATGDNVRQDDLIEVSTEGTGELRLRDDTKLALGPGSRLVLDEFVYNPDMAGGAIVLNLVKGTFRFITGLAAKPAYVIRTPTASITVRGTIFDVLVHDLGSAWLLLIEGAIEVCNVWGECILHNEPGKIIPITADGDVGNPVKWASLPESVPFESAFPFVVGPPAIDIDSHFTPDDIINANFPEEPGTKVQGWTRHDDPPTGGPRPTGGNYPPAGDDYPPPGDDYVVDDYPPPVIVGGPTVIVHGGWIDIPTGCKRRKRCERWNRGIRGNRAARAARRAANREARAARRAARRRERIDRRNANGGDRANRRDAKRRERIDRRNANGGDRANRRDAKRRERIDRRNTNGGDRANRRDAKRAARANRRDAKRAARANRRDAKRANRAARANRRNANRANRANRRNANRANRANRRNAKRANRANRRNANRANRANRRAGNRANRANRRRNANRGFVPNRGRGGGKRRGGGRRRR